MVVTVLRTQLPFVDGTPTSFSFHAILGRYVLGEQAMLFGAITEERKAPTISHRHGEASVDERLPVVRVEDNVAHGTFAGDIRNAPIETNTITGTTLVLAHRLR